MTEFVEEIEHLVTHEPVKVHVTQDDTKPVGRESLASDFGAWSTFVTAGAGDLPRRILTNNRKRNRTQLLVSAGAAGNVAGFIVVGTQAQTQGSQGTGVAGGGRLINGQVVTLENYSDLWMVGDNVNSLTLTIIDEQNR